LGVAAKLARVRQAETCSERNAIDAIGRVEVGLPHGANGGLMH
jgi:hypothetical protein